MIVMAAERKKTVSIRIPVDLGADVSLIAPAFGMSVPEWIEAQLRAAVEQQMPRYLQIAQERARAFKRKSRDDN